MADTAGEGARIFIVDDHPLVREWLAGLIRKEPGLVVVGQADDAAGALASMAVAAPDLAIVDLSLKTDSGLELIKLMRTRFPKTAIIVHSMHEEKFYAERALIAGASGYVTKAESTGRIIEAIRHVLVGGVYASPEVISRATAPVRARRAAAGPLSVASLSDREIEVFQRQGQGHTTRKIAADLKLSMKTVQAYNARIKEKLGLSSGTELTREAVRWVENRRRG